MRFSPLIFSKASIRFAYLSCRWIFSASFVSLCSEFFCKAAASSPKICSSGTCRNFEIFKPLSTEGRLSFLFFPFVIVE